MNEERYQQYLNLIDSILQADSNEQLQQLLAENQNLFDEGLIQTMLYLADNAEAEHENTANYIRNFADNLYQAINAENNQFTQADYNFLMDLLRLVDETQGYKQQVYLYLLQHLNHLTPRLIPCLNYWWENTIPNQPNLETKKALVAVVFNLGYVLQEFSFNKPDCLEIAIQCYKNALLEWKREVVPLDWAMTQNNLANAYTNRIKGDRVNNLEIAIKCYENALLERKREVVPLDWAMTQNNLGSAYSNRMKGDPSENLEEAIKCYENALLERKREVVPLDWAMTQNNLGNAYFYRIKGDRSENLEEAIKCYENALLERKREVVPLDWATTQNNLGSAYLYRIKGDRLENLEEAIKCYENALLERKREVVPLDWAMTQNNLGEAYRNRMKGDRGNNLEMAIKCYENALLERKWEVVPLDWAMTQNNLGEAYRNRIKGDHSKNLEIAIQLFKNALKVYETVGFLFNVAEIALILGKIEVDRGEWYQGLDYLEKSSMICRELNDFQIRADIIYQIARTHHLIGNHEKASTHYRDALRFYRHLKNYQGVAFCQASLGRIMLQNGFIDKADKLLKDAQLIFQEINDEKELGKIAEVLACVTKIKEKQAA